MDFCPISMYVCLCSLPNSIWSLTSIIISINTCYSPWNKCYVTFFCWIKKYKHTEVNTATFNFIPSNDNERADSGKVNVKQCDKYRQETAWECNLKELSLIPRYIELFLPNYIKWKWRWTWLRNIIETGLIVPPSLNRMSAVLRFKINIRKHTPTLARSSGC